MNRKKLFREKQSYLAVMRAWFFLTSSERTALLVIAALVVIGLAARYWHLSHEKAETYHSLEIGRQMTDDSKEQR